MRVGRQSIGESLLTEIDQLLSGDPPFHECTSIDSRASMPLDIEGISYAIAILPPEYMIESDLVQCRARGVSGDVPAYSIYSSICVGDYDSCVPEYDVLYPLFQFQISRVRRLLLLGVSSMG